MIIIDAHGYYLTADVPDTFVPEGTEVWFYSAPGTVLNLAHQELLLVNSESLPEAPYKIGPGKPIRNHMLFSHQSMAKVARRHLIPPSMQDKVVHEINDYTSLCGDSTGLLCTPKTGHKCGGILDTWQSDILVLLICQGSAPDEYSRSHASLVPRVASAKELRALPQATQAFHVGAMSGGRPPKNIEGVLILNRLVELLEALGPFAMCAFRKDYTAAQFIIDLDSAASDPAIQQLEASVEAGRKSVETWFTTFDTLPDEDRTKALLALSSQDRYFAAALSSDVAKFVAAPTLARAVAMKVLAEEGRLGLVWHHALVDGRVQKNIATDFHLGQKLYKGGKELENIESEDHDERLARWLGMSPREREVLRALAGRTASPMPLTAAWLDKLQAALRRMRSHAENIGGLAVLYHTTRPDMAIWAGLWEGDSELRDARERGETEVAEFDDGGEDTRAQIWEDLPSEGRVMLTELSTIASNWSRSDARMLEQARAALAADGDLGLHVFLREPGQDWRLTVDLGDQLTAADAKAGSAVRVFDSASFDERLAAWATFPQRQRDLLVQVSVGARNVRMRVEGFMHQVLNQVHNGTLAELWQCWQRNSLHVAVNLNAPDQSLLADALGQARILITEIVPACRDLDDEVLAQWVTKQNEFTLREVAAADKDLARRIAVITAGNTTRPTDGSGSERTASTTTPTTTTTTVPTRDAALDSTIRAMPPGDVHRFVHGEDVDTDTLLEMLIHSITHHD